VKYHIILESIDRKKLGDFIFKNPTARKKIDSISHPAILYQTLRQIIMAWICGKSFLVVGKNGSSSPSSMNLTDAPLLIETGMNKFLSKVIVVKVSEETQIQRLISRDSISLENALSRVKSQMPLEQKLKRADIVIENEG
jgi:dephospho-CoA kinase